MTPVPSLLPLLTRYSPHDRGSYGNDHLLDLCDSAGTSPGSMSFSPYNDLGTFCHACIAETCLSAKTKGWATASARANKQSSEDHRLLLWAAVSGTCAGTVTESKKRTISWGKSRPRIFPLAAATPWLLDQRTTLVLKRLEL